MSNKLELEFKLEKILGFRNMQEKLENLFSYQLKLSCLQAHKKNYLQKQN